MSVVATDMLPQWKQALNHANSIRLAASSLKRDIGIRRLTVAEAIYDPRAGSLPVLDLLLAQHRWGPKTARPILARHHIPEGKRVRDLTDRQRRLIAEECS